MQVVSIMQSGIWKVFYVMLYNVRISAENVVITFVARVFPGYISQASWTAEISPKLEILVYQPSQKIFF